MVRFYKRRKPEKQSDAFPSLLGLYLIQYGEHLEDDFNEEERSELIKLLNSYKSKDLKS